MKAIASLYDRQGRRKFLTTSERDAFFEAAHDAPAERRTLFFVLAHTGSHIQEALQITAADVDLSGDAIVIGAGAKRRAVPVSTELIKALDTIHGIGRAVSHGEDHSQARLWPVDRTTASRWIGRVMKQAGIAGPQANFRGLRHAYALESLKAGIDPKTLRLWMGYDDEESLAVYVRFIRSG